MPAEQHPSAVYHLAGPDKIGRGRLIYVKDREDGTSDIYLHRLHVRSQLVWDLNWVTRHHVGNGLWRQDWSDDARIEGEPEGLGIAESSWEIVPASRMASGLTVFASERDGSCVWKICSGYCTGHIRDEMNRMLRRIAGDGLWRQSWYERGGPPGRGVLPDPFRVSPDMPLTV